MSAVPAVQNNAQGVLLVAIDDGYAMTKLVTSEGKSLKIPTNARANSEAVKAIFDGESSIGSYEADGERFTVGDALAGEATRFPDFPYSGMNRAIVHHAMVAAGLGGRQVKLATSLPLKTYFRANGEVNRELVTRKIANLRKSIIADNKQPLAHIVENVVYSEALSAWVDQMIDDKGNEVAQARGAVAVIDIGGRTTDIAVIINGSNLDLHRCDTKNIGSLDLYEELRNSLAPKFGLDGNEIPLDRLALAARTGSIRIKGQDHDVSVIVEQHRSEIESRLARTVTQRLGNSVDIDRMIFVGGGAYLFPGIVKRFGDGRATIPHQPDFANARGMLKYMRFVDA